MTAIVYNACYGGFSLSDAAIRRYAEIKGLTLYPETEDSFTTAWWIVPPEQRPEPIKVWHTASLEHRIAYNAAITAIQLDYRSIPRNDPALAQVVRELGRAASGSCAQLELVEVPAGSHYRIDEYDGRETVETPDSYAWSIA